MAEEFETYSIANDEFTIQSDIPLNSQNENDQLLLQRDCDFEKTILTPTKSDTAAMKFDHDIRHCANVQR